MVPSTTRQGIHPEARAHQDPASVAAGRALWSATSIRTVREDCSRRRMSTIPHTAWRVSTSYALTVMLPTQLALTLPDLCLNYVPRPLHIRRCTPEGTRYTGSWLERENRLTEEDLYLSTARPPPLNNRPLDDHVCRICFGVKSHPVLYESFLGLWTWS
ncbi:hypothetical protein DFH07DRAFT_778148 [Mycena maculata]|uniref:Uncharacterized protein n=1 Tax=Mycena maculata TaxID=230809 RepID=A0AAD7IEV1_9AGAR|nr:hypothetical protein DFH07DRAFT_778148 [Mycena maculata]